MPRHIVESFGGDPVRGDPDGRVNGVDLRANIGGDDEGLTAEAFAQRFECANHTEIESVGRSEVIDDAPNERIAWRSLESSDVYNAGSVCFDPAPAGRGTKGRS